MNGHVAHRSLAAVAAALVAVATIAAPFQDASAQTLPVLRSAGELRVWLKAKHADDMVVLIRTSEATAASLDARRPGDGLLAALSDQGGSVAAFGRGAIEVSLETSRADPYALAAFAVGDRITLLGTTTSQKQRKIRSREIERRGPGGVRMETVEYVADEVIVGVRPGTIDMGGEQASFAHDVAIGNPIVRRALMQDAGASTIRKMPNRDDLFLIEGVQGDSWAFCEAKYPGVLFAEPNRIIKMAGGGFAAGGETINDGGTVTVFTDPRLDECWGLKNNGQTGGTPGADIAAAGAWRITLGSPNVVVAVIDSGADLKHPDLRNRLWVNPGEIPGNGEDDDGNGYKDDVHGFDFINVDADGNADPPYDDFFVGHGTHVAGTIAAAVNGVGVVGVAPRSRLMICKIFDANGTTTEWAASHAVIYAADNGAAVTNSSWGGIVSSAAIKTAFEHAAARDVVNIAAAGNGATTQAFYPASYDTVLSVTATDHNDQPASFTNAGTTTDLAAPGVDVLSCLPRALFPSGYGLLSGTSMASPHVAGVAALMRARDPGASAQAIRLGLQSAVDPIDTHTHDLGNGRINARTAVRRAHNPELLCNLDFTTFNYVEPFWTERPIIGTAAGAEFDHYVLEIGGGLYPASWATLATGAEPVTDGVLAVVGPDDLGLLPTGYARLRLRVVDAAGTSVFHSEVVSVTNVRIVSPQDNDVIRKGDLIQIYGTTGGTTGFTSYEVTWNTFAAPGFSNGITLVNGGTSQVTGGGLLATLDTSVVTGDLCYINLIVHGDGDSMQHSVPLFIDETLAPGFPARINFDLGETRPLNALDPLIVDLDGNGGQEIYALQTSMLHGIDDGGDPLLGFPVQLPDGPNRLYTTSSLTLADIDADGEFEILFGSSLDDTIEVFVVEADGSFSSLAFTYDGAQGPAVIRPYSSVVVDDLDADGQDDIVFQAFDILVVAHADGTLIPPGGLIHLRQGAGSICEVGAPFPIPATSIDATPAVGDLDGDPELEIVVFHQVADCVVSPPTGDLGVIRVLDPDGTTLPGWPRTVAGPALGSSPAIGDLDGLGGNEIVIAAGAPSGGVYVFDAGGDLMPGWPQLLLYHSFTNAPALADLDDDGDLEIVIGDGYARYTYLYDHDGTPFSTPWLYGASSQLSSAITDVDHDGVLDVVATQNDYLLDFAGQHAGPYAWSLAGGAGQTMPGFPRRIEANAWAPVQVVDLDGDGTLEAVGSAFMESWYADTKHRGSIYVWELPWADTPTTAQQWPTFHGNYRRTGRYGDN